MVRVEVGYAEYLRQRELLRGSGVSRFFKEGGVHAGLLSRFLRLCFPFWSFDRDRELERGLYRVRTGAKKIR